MRAAPGKAELQRLRGFEVENRRLARMVAEQALDIPVTTWRKECNTERPHKSLGRQTPAEHAAPLTSRERN